MENGTIELQPFGVSVPKVSGDGIERFITIQIPMEWDAEISEWLMTEDGSRMVEETKCQAMGLLPNERYHRLPRRGLGRHRRSPELPRGNSGIS